MNIGPWLFLDALAACLRALALPFTLTGLACATAAAPFLAGARALNERARQWRLRFWSRGGHTDLCPPPGAPGSPSQRRDS